MAAARNCKNAPSTELHQGRIARKPGMATQRQLHSCSTLRLQFILNQRSVKYKVLDEDRRVRSLRWRTVWKCSTRLPH